MLELAHDRSDLMQPVGNYSELLKIQVIWAVRHEMARTVEDVLARRTRLLFRDAQKAIELAPAVAELMRVELGKDENWQTNQVAEFESLAKGYLLAQS